MIKVVNLKFYNLIQVIATVMEKKDFELIMLVMWSIWSLRNKALFEYNYDTLQKILEREEALLDLFRIVLLSNTLLEVDIITKY